ncbi:MAG TPA: protein arginine kinase [Victivallales bacterium]|nr:protein arginine kinase [Victivallales bacterium]
MDNEYNIDKFLHKPVSWLSVKDNDDNIAISSRIRLARNISGINFPLKSDIVEREHVLKLVTDVITKDKIKENSKLYRINELPVHDRNFLLERRLISKEFCSGLEGSALIISEDEKMGIMVNEEDHIRMQVLRSGCSLREIWSEINQLDDMFSNEFPLAFNNTLGYLTSCPTNVGTGMRASVMLDLPGLTLIGHINGVIYGAGKLGLAIRGLHGEGSEPLGNLYQVSNQSTLGENEEAIIQRLENIIGQIVNHEKNARKVLLETKRDFLLDYIGRSYGNLCYSYILSAREALNSISALRMGVVLKMFSSLDMNKINELFIAIQDAHLQKFAGRKLNSSERDVFRAELVRNKLKS